MNDRSHDWLSARRTFCKSRNRLPSLRAEAQALGLDKLAALSLIALGAWCNAGLLAQARADTSITIQDTTGLNSSNSRGLQLYYGFNQGSPSTWTNLKFGSSATITLPADIKGGTLQVILASPSGIAAGQTPATALVGPGYSQLYEFTTLSAPYTFDISTVNNFSFPSIVRTTAPGLNNLGNPSTLSREEIYSKYQTYTKELGYGNLIIGSQPSASAFAPGLSSPFTYPPGTVPTTTPQAYQNILNPGQAVIPGAIKLVSNAVATDVNTSPFDTTWETFLSRVRSQGSFQLYSPAFQKDLPAATLTGTASTSIAAAKIFGNCKPSPGYCTLGNNYLAPTRLDPNKTYYNQHATFSGLTLTGVPTNSTGSTTTTAYIPTPSDITAQLLWKARPDKSSHNIIIPKNSTRATMTVSAADAQKLQPGMFLVSSNNYFKNLSTSGAGATKSDVMITAITPNSDNSGVTLTLQSPGGNLQTTAPTNQNNAVVLFSNINDRSQANSPASVWLANTWPLNSNQAFDNEIYCRSALDNCPVSKWVGQVKTQINQAMNWGSLAAPLPSSSTLINTVWANPSHWYTYTDDNGNPAYNIYSAFWHTQDVSIPFSTNPPPYDAAFGAAYGFSVDENPYGYPGSTLPMVQVPSKWDGTLPAGSTVTITLLPWLNSTSSSDPCVKDNTVCWATGSGSFATNTNWALATAPSPVTPYSLISFQQALASAGGTATNNIPALTAQGIEYGPGAGSYTIAGNPIAITGRNGFAISNESGTKQTITAPINLIGSSRLSLNVTEDSSLTLSGGLESALGWRKAGSGLLTLDGLSRGTASTGRIAVAGGTLALNNSDLSNYAGISSARSTVIEGSGTLPGTGSGLIQGLLAPGTDATVVGKLNFAGDLAFGFGGGAVLNNLSTTPSSSDLIGATGNLSINSERSSLFIGSVSASGSSYWIPLLSIDSTKELLGEFSSVYGLNQGQTLVYRTTGNNRGVFLHAIGSGPRPTDDCILRGDPATTSAPYANSFCGGRLIVDSGTSNANWTLERTTGTNRIDLAGYGSTINFNGVFNGAGDLSFENTGLNTDGSIRLNGQNSYTGPTRIGAGTRVSVNGSIASSSSLRVDPGGTVAGNGLLPRTFLTLGATIAPGNSIGTLTAAALDLNGGTIAAEIQGPQNDRINVTGAVTNFTGTASLSPFGGGSPFPGFTYTIVSAPASPSFATSSSLNLDQSQVSSALLRFGTTLVQNPLGNPQAFAVQWQPNHPSGATTAAMQALGNGGGNALCLATALDRALNALSSVATNNANNSGTAIGTTGFTTGQAAAAGMSAGFLEALNSLVLLPSGNQLVAAVNSLSAQPFAAFQSVALETLKQQRQTTLGQAGQCLSNGWVVNGKQAKHPLCAFALAQNSTTALRGDDNLASYNAGIFSSGIGLEYYPSQQWSVGVSYGYGTSYANNFSTAPATITAGVNSVNLFSSYRATDRWSLRALLGYSNFNLESSRSMAFLGNGANLSANPNGNGITAALETDYSIPLTRPSATTQAILKPLLGLAWGSYQQSGFTESGNALSLAVDSNTANSFITTAGVELTTSPIPLNRSRNLTVRPALVVSYQVDALADRSANKSVNASFSQAAGVCGSCSSEGQNLGASGLNVSGGVDVQIGESTAVYVNASYSAYSNASQFGYGGGVRVRF